MRKNLAIPVLLCLLQFKGGVANAQMPNMWSTGQPITASMTESPAGTVHAPGTKSYTITATDTDTAFPGYIGPVPDTLTYTWTATRGTISGGASAAWSIPADTRGLISCQVVIDDVATMPPGDFGARNDNPITLNRSMVVPYANAEYEAFSTDNMYGIAKFRFKLSNVGCTCQQLKVEYQEQASGYHQCDWTPILTEGNPAQLISTTTDADGVVNQIYEMSWNTLGLHNADYQLRLKADYNCNCHQTAFRSVEQIHTVNVKNLDITTCNPNGNVDYLRWDPEQSLADTTIQSTLEDHGGTTGTTLSINIYHSDRTANPTPVRTVTVTTDGNPVKSYTWDGKDSSGVNCSPGIYLFTVSASHSQTGGGDSVSDRASDASIVEDRLVDADGPDLRQIFESKVSGLVSNAKLLVFNDTYQLIGAPITGATSLGSDVIPIVTSDWLPVGTIQHSKPTQIELVLMNGIDGTPKNDKSHTARPVLGRNIVPKTMSISVYKGQDIAEGITIDVGDADIFWNTMAYQYGYVTWQNKRVYLKPGEHKLSPSSAFTKGVFPCHASAYTIKTGVQQGWLVKKLNYRMATGIFSFSGHGSADFLTGSDDDTLSYMQGIEPTINPLGSQPLYDYGIPRLAVLMSCNTYKPGNGVDSIADYLQSSNYTVIATQYKLKNPVCKDFISDFLAKWNELSLDMTPSVIKTALENCQKSAIRFRMWYYGQGKFECLEAL